MRTLPIVTLVAIAALLLVACGKQSTSPGSAATSPAAAADRASSVVTSAEQPTTELNWNNLDAAVGKYQNDFGLFGVGQVPDALQDLLGDKFDLLQNNLTVAGPLRKSAAVYYITGNAAHQGGVEQAYVLLDPATQAIEVGLWQQGTLTVLATPDAHLVKPADVETMIANTHPVVPPGH
ncbi:MAG TPA: hypothetical protein VFN09_07225 [Rhodanobacteraceae bacterium]|nr:hypothetical protein [Rhodanobacteraceae bacterium]